MAAKNQAKNKRNTKQINEARVHRVSEWMLKGYTRQMILQAASKEQWGVSFRSVDAYSRKAREMLDAEFKKTLPHQLADIIRKLDAIFEKGFSEKDDLHVARAALMDRAKLLGLVKSRVEIDDEREYEDEADEDIVAACQAK